MKSPVLERRGADPLGMHVGNVLMMIADTYPTIVLSLLECIQNAMDIDAKTIWVTINQKAGFASVRDNGDGASPETFAKALRSVCKSEKGKGKFGRYGRGLISPLGKCNRFTFTSTPRGEDTFIEWVFVSADIGMSEELPEIPRRVRTDLTRESVVGIRGRTQVAWNTEISFHNMLKDPRLSAVDMDDLVENILVKYGGVMVKKGIVVKIELTNHDGQRFEREVTATTATGTPLEPFVTGREGKKTTFNLFIARKAGNAAKGRVLVREAGDEFRIAFPDFLRTTDLVSKEVAAALTSGFFEGEISSECLVLHPERTRFREGEGLLAFTIALKTWFEKVGKGYLEEVEADRKDARRQELGEASLKYIEDLIMRNPEFANLRQLVESFKIGNIGKGHTSVPKKNRVGTDTNKSIAVSGSGGESGGTDRDGDDGESTRSEHTGHSPFTVAGPRGVRRMLVKGGSTGLQFCFTELLASRVMWELDTKSGILNFNTRHEAWMRCEDAGDKHLRQFQECVAIQALTLAMVPEPWRERVRAFAEDAVNTFSVMLTSSDAFKARMEKH